MAFLQNSDPHSDLNLDIVLEYLDILHENTHVLYLLLRHCVPG